jgi:ribonuclease-3
LAGKLDRLLQQLEIEFHDRSVLKQAFTHSSYRNEHRSDTKDNERLEFLGDAVLELLVSDYLYHAYPHMSEGDLTRMRAAIVCEASLVRFARKVHFEEYIRLGRGEELSGGRYRPSLLADVFEAFLGALYLDQGLEAPRRFLEQHVFPELRREVTPLLDDFKTMLQEFVQRENKGSLSYRIVEERGPAHSKEFVAAVYVDGKPYGQGTGRSKKEAEQRAAAEALRLLKAQP